MSKQQKLFDGFSRIAKVQQAKIELEKAKNNQSQVSESLSLAHKVALSNYLTAYHSQKQKSESLELSKKIYLKTMAKYREGLVSTMELSQSGADYSQAQSDNAQAIYNLLIAKTNYNRSVETNENSKIIFSINPCYPCWLWRKGSMN